MSDDKDRNPLFVPEPVQKRLACPKCNDPDNFSGRRVQGVVTFTCTKCGNKWHGGLPQEPQDPRVPYPPDPNPPSVTYVAGRSANESLELRRRVDLRQEFRKGAPLKEDGED